MAEKNNATCSICGEPYYLCIHCKDKMKLHPYKIYCCSPTHFQVFQVVRGFSTGVYSKDEAKEKFKNIDLKDIETFRPHIKNIIKDILKEDNTVVRDVTEVKIEETETIKNFVKPTVSRKKNYRANNEIKKVEE